MKIARFQEVRFAIVNRYYLVKNNNADGFELELRNSVDSFLKKKIAKKYVKLLSDLLLNQ